MDARRGTGRWPWEPGRTLHEAVLMVEVAVVSAAVGAMLIAAWAMGAAG